jgi:sarcosine oxidase subunit alpha
MSATRLPQGGLIDRSRELGFTFEGRQYVGYAGDTLASALLAHGVAVVGRSFKLHRPRGLMAAGVEEPNALMQLGSGARSDANPRATEIEIYAGLTARAVNCWPSVDRDLGAVNNLLGRFIPAGFFYKTFMWPHWHLFEPLIRGAAGLGTAPALPDPDRYESRFAHCDVLVVGAGPAGLAAALAAGSGGARVILCEQDAAVGGSLRWDGGDIDGLPAADWARRTAVVLAARPETMVLTRTTACGYFDHNALALLERVADHRGPAAPPGLPRQRLWQVRAGRVVLATGALERPLVFPGNDRPGVMLASAVRQYLGQWAVRAGERAVIFTNNDAAYATAHALRAAGAAVQAVVDVRGPGAPAQRAAAAAGMAVVAGGAVVATRGRPALTSVRVRDAAGAERWVAADLLAMSGGMNPTIHLFRQSGGQLAWDDAQALFKPGRSAQAEQSAGACAGVFSLAAVLQDGHRAGVAAAAQTGRPADMSDPPACQAEPPQHPIAPLWRVDAPGHAFVDFQNDVTTDDIALSAREGYVSVEHLKRYTALGMAPDQGKTANVNAVAIMAGLTGKSIPQTGTTLYRFPFTPVPLGALAGRTRGDLFRPIQLLPAHACHVAAGAVFDEYGGWKRPAYYPRLGEGAHQAEQREARTVREAVGLFDSSPLGKIEIIGPDAGKLLDLVYANAMSTLPVGCARYGLMLNELGVIMDDGVAQHLAPDHFLVGTTSGGATRIAAWLEEWLQCEWPHLQVLVAPLTTSIAVLTLAGPLARAVLLDAGTDIDLSPGAFPHMSLRTGSVAGIEVRICRVSFTGEVSFEINAPARRAECLWHILAEAGRRHGLAPVGIDAWMLLRTEKGYLHVGVDTDGTTVPDDVGWGRVLRRADDFLGKRSLTRPENLRSDRLQFVGFTMTGAAAPDTFLPIGAHIRGAAPQGGSDGYVTSAGYSPALRCGVALGMLRRGRDRHGDMVAVLGPSGPIRATVTAPGAYDPDGKRLHG